VDLLHRMLRSGREILLVDSHMSQMMPTMCSPTWPMISLDNQATAAQPREVPIQPDNPSALMDPRGSSTATIGKRIIIAAANAS